MFRTHLMGAVSAAALSCFAVAAQAQTPSEVVGSGSTLAFYDYNAEIAAFNSTVPAGGYGFRSYIPNVGSGSGRRAFLLNDYTCATRQSAGLSNTCTTSNSGGGANTVHYGASDATLSTAEIGTWSTGTWGNSAAGQILQLPTIGTGVALAVGLDASGAPLVAANNGLKLKDFDICAIYSGLYTDWSQITDITDLKTATGGNKPYVVPLSGTIYPAYRTDGSGTTFLFTNHLAAVCKNLTGSTPTGFTFTTTQSFSTLLANVPAAAKPNFRGFSGSAGVAAGLNGKVTTDTTKLANIGYISPDYTSVITSSAVTSALTVAGLFQQALATAGSANPYLTPVFANVKTGLAKFDASAQGASGTSVPTTATAARNPNAWVPVLPVTTAGYPIVGYTIGLFAQCYADPKVSAAVTRFLNLHYNNATYKTIQTNNGFVPLANASKQAAFLTLIKNKVLANNSGGTGIWNFDIGNSSVCGPLAGR